MSVVVSVLLPVYNGADFVREAINSILLQSFEDFELIIRDDRSSDRTRELIKEFIDKRIVVIENRANLGLFGNLNACFEVSSGEFVQLFSQDDIMHVDCLESQLKLLRKYKNAGMVYCGNRTIDKSGRVLHDGSGDETPELIGRDLYLSLSAHYWSLPPSISTVMIRRGILEKVGLFDSRMKVAGDVELWNRIGDRYPIVRNPKIVADIRAHKGQAMNADMSGLWYMQEEIGLMDWHRKRLAPGDWAAVQTFRTRTRAVTYWAWIMRQFLKGHMLRAIRGILVMSKGYNPILVFCYYCFSLNRRFFRPNARIRGN